MIFGDLTAQEMAVLESVATPLSLPEHRVVVEDGAAGDSFFFILAGRVEVRKYLGDRTRYKRLAELGPCGLFGEVCFLGVPSRTATVVTLTPCRLLEFGRPAFDALVARNPLIGMKAFRGLARELASRLAVSDDELKATILWALAERPARGSDEAGTGRPALRIAPRA